VKITAYANESDLAVSRAATSADRGLAHLSAQNPRMVGQTLEDIQRDKLHVGAIGTPSSWILPAGRSMSFTR